MIRSYSNPELAPPIEKEELRSFWSDPQVYKNIFMAFLLPFVLILMVLGSIFSGIATPTEAAAVGALGASVLTLLNGGLNRDVIKKVSSETTRLTSMVFFILIGATCFSFVFKELGGDTFLVESISSSNLSARGFLLLVMLIVFVAGFFIDFIEIVFIIVPVVSPIFVAYDVNLIWIGILLALNLQTSFLTPPFGFALFYLKGVAPPGITTRDIYRGVLPFVCIQILFLLGLIFFPELLIF